MAARIVQNDGLASQVLIIDLDVHQGDGTAVIFENDPTVFTFSMHCQNNFPFRKQRSDLDIPLPEGLTDAAYLRTLATHLPDILTAFKPELVLYDAGVDPHRADRLGKLALSDEGLYQRDKLVLELCLERGYPVATVVGGGYDNDISALSYRHVLLHRAATEVYQRI